MADFEILKFDEIKTGAEVNFYALVEALQKRFTQANASYYCLTLSDGQSSVDARVWNCNLVETNDIKTGVVYKFSAKANDFNGKAQYVVNNILPVNDGEIDLSIFIKSAPLSKEELIDGLKVYIRKITNENLRKLVINLYANTKDKIFDYPAAMSMHHNYLCGLAYHTYSMCKLADKVLEIYPGMNANLLYAGVLIHDVGKTLELSAPISPTYTEDGNLLGHIVIGLQMVAVAAEKEGIAGSEEVRMIEHMIASHHGELEFGSPKEPGIMEAYALHLIDLMDSKLAAISPEVVKAKKGTHTSPIGSLNRKTLYKPNLE